MAIGIIETLAIIIIAISVIKLIIFTINSQWWYSSVEKLYVKPKVLSVVALLLAGVVLYLLINAGVTIVEILAVCLFIALIMLIGFAHYGEGILAWAKEQDVVHIAKQLWLYLLVWMLLLAWGAGEILLS